MPNKIQIKRTTVTGRTPNTTNSSNTRYIDAGELSLNLTDAKLFSSDGTNYFEVGSNLNSIAVGGTFTANATLVNAAALNVVNRTNTATLYVTPSANVGTALTVNSTSVNVGANVDIDSGTLTVDTVLNRVGVNTAIGSIGGAALYVTSSPGATSAIEVLAGSHFMKILPNMNAGNYNGLTAAGDTGLIFSNNTQGFGNLLIGSWSAASFGIKFNSSANSITIAGNTVNISTSLSIGSATVNSALANLQALNVVNQTNTATLFATTSANVGTNVQITTSQVTIGNTSVNSLLSSSTLNFRSSVSNSQLILSSDYLTVTSANSSSNASIIAYIDSNQFGVIELGGTTGSYIDFKAPYADDYDTRFMANTSGFFIIGASGTNTSNSVTINTANLNINANVFTNGLVNAANFLTTGSVNAASLNLTTSANVASAFLANSTGAYHTGTMNAASHTVGTTTVVNSTAIALGPFGTTNGVLITTTSLDIGNTTANAALDYNIIYVANSTARANLTPTTLAIGSITVNSALANLQALNVVNQTNTGTLFVTTSANVASAFLANSTGAYHIGTINAASHTVGTNFTSNSSQMVLNAPSYTVSFSNTNGSATNFITWSTSLQQAVPSVTTRSIGTKIIFYDGLSGSTTDWAYGLAGSEMWASVGATTGTFRWYAVTTAFMTSNTTFLNHNAQVRVGGGVGTTNGTTITNTSIAVGNSTINTSANSTAILVNGTDLVATQKRSIAMSLVFGR